MKGTGRTHYCSGDDGSHRRVGGSLGLGFQVTGKLPFLHSRIPEAEIHPRDHYFLLILGGAALMILFGYQSGTTTCTFLGERGRHNSKKLFNHRYVM